MTDGATASIGSAAVLARPGRWRKTRSILRWIPGFGYFLIFYAIVELLVPNVREPVLSFTHHQWSWVDMMYPIAAFVAMAELFKVSKPGEDNTWEAIMMLAAWIVYLLLFAFALMGGSRLAIFNTTEFGVITAIGMFQVVMGFILNARTLRRSINYDNSGADYHG